MLQASAPRLPEYALPLFPGSFRSDPLGILRLGDPVLDILDPRCGEDRFHVVVLVACAQHCCNGFFVGLARQQRIAPLVLRAERAEPFLLRHQRRRAAALMAQKKRLGPFGAQDEGRDPLLARKAHEKAVAAMLRAGHQYDHVKAILAAARIEDVEDWIAEAEDAEGIGAEGTGEQW